MLSAKQRSLGPGRGRVRFLPRGRARVKQTLRFYSRPDCPLCDKGLPAVRRLARRHGLELEKVNIASDPGLEARHGRRIPVVEVAGRTLGWGLLSERALERELARWCGEAG